MAADLHESLAPEIDVSVALKGVIGLTELTRGNGGLLPDLANDGRACYG